MSLETNRGKSSTWLPTKKIISIINGLKASIAAMFLDRQAIVILNAIKNNGDLKYLHQIAAFEINYKANLKKANEHKEDLIRSIASTKCLEVNRPFLARSMVMIKLLPSTIRDVELMIDGKPTLIKEILIYTVDKLKESDNSISDENMSYLVDLSFYLLDNYMINLDDKIFLPLLAFYEGEQI